MSVPTPPGAPRRNAPTRILVFVPGKRHHRPSGGVEGVVRNLAENLTASGYEVHKMYLKREGHPPQGSKGNVWWLPLEYPQTRFQLPRPISGLRMLVSLARLARRLSRIRPDVVHIHTINLYALYFRVLQPVFRYKLVLTGHGKPCANPANSIERRLRPALLDAADRITTVSHDVYGLLAERYPQVLPKAEVIHNGVDVDFWSDTSGVEHREPSCIVNVAKLLDVKGQGVLVQALPAVIAEHPSCHLVLVGNGPNEQKLRALAASLGVAEHVRFEGFQSPERVRQWLHRATIFALPSRHEGFSLALLEALAAGAPAVGSAVGGVPEVLSDDVGVLVPAEDAGALGEALKALLADAPRRALMSACAKHRMEAFCWPAITRQYQALYRRVLGGTGPAPSVPSDGELKAAGGEEGGLALAVAL